jgi:hypothetical protein
MHFTSFVSIFIIMTLPEGHLAHITYFLSTPSKVREYISFSDSRNRTERLAGGYISNNPCFRAQRKELTIEYGLVWREM